MLLGTITLGLKQSQQRMMLKMRQWEAGRSRSKGHRFCVSLVGEVEGTVTMMLGRCSGKVSGKRQALNKYTGAMEVSAEVWPGTRSQGVQTIITW